MSRGLKADLESRLPAMSGRPTLQRRRTALTACGRSPDLGAETEGAASTRRESRRSVEIFYSRRCHAERRQALRDPFRQFARQRRTRASRPEAASPADSRSHRRANQRRPTAKFFDSPRAGLPVKRLRRHPTRNGRSRLRPRTTTRISYRPSLEPGSGTERDASTQCGRQDREVGRQRDNAGSRAVADNDKRPRPSAGALHAYAPSIEQVAACLRRDKPNPAKPIPTSARVIGSGTCCAEKEPSRVKSWFESTTAYATPS
jgi:hypothetical protein